MHRLVTVGATTSAAAMLLAAPGPRAALHTVAGAGQPQSDPTAALVAAATLIAWALAGWLVLTAVLTSGAGLGGRTGGACAALLRRTAPAALRRAAALALGVGVVLGGAGTASAAGPPPRPTVSAAAALDWPGSPISASAAAAGSAPSPRPAGGGSGLDWPGSPARPGEVVVATGDTLWGLAAARLPAGASDTEVAVLWPTWWAANRAVIGDDPGLLHPGQHLVPPDQPATGR